MIYYDWFTLLSHIFLHIFLSKPEILNHFILNFSLNRLNLYFRITAFVYYTCSWFLIHYIFMENHFSCYRDSSLFAARIGRFLSTGSEKVDGSSKLEEAEREEFTPPREKVSCSVIKRHLSDDYSLFRSSWYYFLAH